MKESGTHENAWRVVKVEQKDHCDPAWVQNRKIAGCGFFYLYDANRHVHICSFTQSYELIALHEYAYFDAEVSDDVAEEVDEALRLSEEPVSYMDVYDIQNLPNRSLDEVGVRVTAREVDEADDAYYMRVSEEIREHLVGNPIWF